MSYKIKKFLMSNGERGCLILDKETQLPVYYQNLYLTTNCMGPPHIAIFTLT
ncbi:TPA: hypothetical protein ACUISZ_005362, partial [Klebsiella pneumoniae]